MKNFYIKNNKKRQKVILDSNTYKEEKMNKNYKNKENYKKIII
jgi:hypothetical protein